VPHGRWSSITLIATLTTAGLGPGLQFDGAMDRPIFDRFVAGLLVPSLRSGQIVVMDNLAVHKSRRARKMIEAAGCEIRFLPTYSPDCNPIEVAFSQLRHHLRCRQPRSITDIFELTTAIYPLVTATHAKAYFRQAHYPP
jgi:transposase